MRVENGQMCILAPELQKLESGSVMDLYNSELRYTPFGKDGALTHCSLSAASSGQPL